MARAVKRHWLYSGEFREVPGYPGVFASKDGQIRKFSGKRGIQLPNDTPTIHFDKKGRRKFAHNRMPVYVCRMVALAWLPPPENPEWTYVRHKDGDHHNDHVDNLEWMDPADYRKCKRPKVEYQYDSTRSVEKNKDKALLMRRLYDAGFTASQIAERLGVSSTTVRNAAIERTWSSVWGRGWHIDIEEWDDLD